MRVSILPLGRRPAIDALEQGEIDLALGFAWNLPRSIKQTTLYDESYSVVMRQGHPLSGKQSTLEVYTDAEHLIVSPRGGWTSLAGKKPVRVTGLPPMQQRWHK